MKEVDELGKSKTITATPTHGSLAMLLLSRIGFEGRHRWNENQSFGYTASQVQENQH